MKIRIAEIRKRRKMKQIDLADKIGVARPYMSQIESGSRNVTAKRLNDIAKALNVSPSELIDYDQPEEVDSDLILEAFENASPEQRKMWLAMAKSILEK